MTTLLKRRPGPTARARRAKADKDARHAAQIRALVWVRDCGCRAASSSVGQCDYLSAFEWAHLGEKKRFKTRGLAPEERHTTAGTLILCRRHHNDYDQGRLVIRGDDANGELTFVLKGTREQ